METVYFPSAEAAVNELCRRAADEGASDIHIEPEKDSVRIRFRTDGFLHEIFRLPSAMGPQLAVRCKVMGKMNVAETRVPQDGGAGFSHEDVSYDLRISTLPSIYGETIVLRLLSGKLPFIEQNRLGMFPEQETLFRRALSKSGGMILTTGPTGSGKTSTLYAALKIASRPEVSVISIEDPVEYKIPGITQINVNEKAGLTFASGLRALVRQDPDILMVGEIRDKETAEIAVHAALTGHLVLSSLHTNKAAQAPLRLIDMGIPAYLLSASLSLILSQRLVPTLCPRCKEPLPEGKGFRAKGCDHCRGTGYLGRTGVFEMLSVTTPVREAIHQMRPFQILEEQMKEQGQLSLSEAALRHAREGTISCEDASCVAASAE